ncbi:MAG: globin domain-containing protein [Thiohalocapsa sp.]
MSPNSIAAVKASWTEIAPISDQTGFMLYTRLFELHPELRALFKIDIKEQVQALMRMIDAAVCALDEPAPMLERIKALGARHAPIGVSAADYAKLGDALIWTLERALGERFKPALWCAWTELYVLLSDIMQIGDKADARL